MALTWDKLLALALPVLYSIAGRLILHDWMAGVVVAAWAIPGFIVLVRYWWDPNFGQRTGYWTRGGYISKPTPGILLAAFGWLWILSFPAFILVQMSSSRL